MGWMNRTGVLRTAVMAAAILCALCGCHNNVSDESDEAPEQACEAGTWRPGQWARVAITPDREYRVQQDSTSDVRAVAGLLKKAGAVTAEPIVIDAPVEVGLAAVQTLRAALKAHGYELVWYKTADKGSATRPVAQPTAGETFEAEFLAWASEQGLDTSTTPVVVAGEVVSADCREGAAPGRGAGRAGQWVTLRIESCLKLDRQGAPGIPPEGWLDPSRHRWLATEGGEGLWPGDKVLILLEEYEGVLAIAPRSGGGCRLGARLSGWDDPLIEAVRFALAQGMDKAISHETYGPILSRAGAVAAEDVDQGE